MVENYLFHFTVNYRNTKLNLRRDVVKCMHGNNEFKFLSNFYKVVFLIPVLLNGHLCRLKTYLRSTMGQDRLCHLAYHVFIALMLRDYTLKKSLMTLLQEKVVASSFSNRFLDQNNFVIYFESCKNMN